MNADLDFNDQEGAELRCRACGQSISEDAPQFPFCSDRCRQVDLGRWFDGNYRISREIKDSDLETVD